VALSISKITRAARRWWLTPVTPATQEAEIRRIIVQSQLGQIICKTLSQKYSSRKRAGGVTQGVGPEFKSQYQKKKTHQGLGLGFRGIAFA
jgi:hypothetical protein